MENTKNSKCLKIITGIVAAAMMISAVFALSGCGGSSESYDSISVTEIVGDVTVENNGDTYKAYPNMKLTDGFAMSTAAESYSGMMLDSEKYARLEENSRARFEATGSGGRSTAIVLEYGELYNEIMRPLNNGEDYVVTTPNAVLCIRGTIFVARVVKDSDGRQTTEIYTFDGAVSTRRVTEEEDIVVSSGYKAVIQSDGDATYYVKASDEAPGDNILLIDIKEIDTDILVYVYAASKSGRSVCFTNDQMEDEFRKRGVDITQYTSHITGDLFDPIDETNNAEVIGANAAEAAAVKADNKPSVDQADQKANEAISGGSSSDSQQESHGDGAEQQGADAAGAEQQGADDISAEQQDTNGDGTAQQGAADPAAPTDNGDEAAPAAQDASAAQQSAAVTTAAAAAAQQPAPAEQKQDEKKPDEQKPEGQKQEDKQQEEKSSGESDKDKDQKQDSIKDDEPKEEEKRSGTADDKKESTCEHKYRLGAVTLKSGKGKNGTYTAKLICDKCSEKADVTGKVGRMDFESGNTVTYHIDFVYDGNTYPGTYTVVCPHNYFYQESDDPIFIWNSDHTRCTARFECLNGCGAYVEVRCNVEDEGSSVTAWCDRGEITFSETYTGEGYTNDDDDDDNDGEFEIEDL